MDQPEEFCQCFLALPLENRNKTDPRVRLRSDRSIRLSYVPVGCHF